LYTDIWKKTLKEALYNTRDPLNKKRGLKRRPSTLEDTGRDPLNQEGPSREALKITQNKITQNKITQNL